MPFTSNRRSRSGSRARRRPWWKKPLSYFGLNNGPRNRKPPKILNPLAAGTALGAVCGIGLFAWATIDNQIGQSPVISACSTGQPPSPLAVISDTTNEIPQNLGGSVGDLLREKLPAGFQKNMGVYLYALTAEPHSPVRKEFAECSGKRGRDAIVVFETGKILEEKWESDFKAPYLDAVERLPASKTLGQSPILEAVRVVYEDTLKRHPTAERVSLHVVTDGLIHSAQGPTIYVTSGSRYILDPAITAGLKAAAPNLDKAEIHLHIIPRPEMKDRRGRLMLPRQRLITDWLVDYFESAGATVTEDPL